MSRIHSILFQKCPYCQKGDMFIYKPLSTRFYRMHDNCPSCGEDFVKEPSFYVGAMYVSYAIQIAMIVAVYVALRITIDPGVWTYITWMLVGVVAIVPFNFRVSRTIWLTLFLPSKRNAKN